MFKVIKGISLVKDENFMDGRNNIGEDTDKEFER